MGFFIFIYLRIINYILPLLVCFVLFSCKAKKIKAKDTVLEKTAFYTLKVVNDSVKKVRNFSVVKIDVVNTKINYWVDESKLTEPNFLKLEIIDKKDKTIKVFAEHPLFKRFDLYSESGQIESKLISLQQGEVVLRVPYFYDYKKIVITETVNRIASKQIIITNEK